MANTQDIRRRIKSIRNTAQITKAMQMVAASKMRKAQQHALAGRPYATLMNRVFVSLQKRTDPKLHPLLEIRPLKKELVLMTLQAKVAGALPAGLTLEVSVTAPAGATSNGFVTLTAAYQDLTSVIPKNKNGTLTITHRLSATSAAGVIA